MLRIRKNDTKTTAKYILKHHRLALPKRTAFTLHPHTRGLACAAVQIKSRWRQ
jgi:hypothetical protein